MQLINNNWFCKKFVKINWGSQLRTARNKYLDSEFIIAELMGDFSTSDFEWAVDKEII